MEQQSIKQINRREYIKKYNSEQRSSKAISLEVYFEQCVKFINSQIPGKLFTRKLFYKEVGIYHFKKQGHPIDNYRKRFEKLGYMQSKGHKFWVVKSIPEGYTHAQLIGECRKLMGDGEIDEIVSADMVEVSLMLDGTIEPGYTNVKYKNQ